MWEQDLLDYLSFEKRVPLAGGKGPRFELGPHLSPACRIRRTPAGVPQGGANCDERTQPPDEIDGTSGEAISVNLRFQPSLDLLRRRSPQKAPWISTEFPGNGFYMFLAPRRPAILLPSTLHAEQAIVSAIRGLIEETNSHPNG